MAGFNHQLSNVNKSLEDIDIQYLKDYEFTDDCECIIYTPDSFNYNSGD